MGYGNWGRDYYPNLVGFSVEAVRVDYCRMRLAYRPILEQPAGVVHGGAIASLIDSVVVPAIGSVYEPSVGFATIDLSVQYLAALREEDAILSGGGRASGTNDKAGSALNLLRWTSPRSIKETLVPPTDHRYPHMS